VIQLLSELFYNFPEEKYLKEGSHIDFLFRNERTTEMFINGKHICTVENSPEVVDGLIDLLLRTPHTKKDK